MEKELKFQKERETKNTIRYREAPEPGQAPVMGTIYIQKWFLGEKAPEEIRIVVKK